MHLYHYSVLPYCKHFILPTDRANPRRSTRTRTTTKHFGNVWSVDCLLEEWIGKGGIPSPHYKNETTSKPISLMNKVSTTLNYIKYIPCMIEVVCQHIFHANCLCFLQVKTLSHAYFVNEIDSIKHGIFKSLARCKTARNGHIGVLKNMCVDLPLSRQCFNQKWVGEIPRIPPYVDKNISCFVCIEELDEILGPKWNLVQTKGTSTQARVIGLVKLQYRMKYAKVQRHISPG